MIAVFAAAGSLLLLTATAALFCESTLHVPRRPPAAMRVRLAPDATWRTAALRARDNVTLESWFVHPGQPTGACVVILHGIGDSRLGVVGFAPMFLDAGYSVLLPDSRAHGASGGELVTYGLLEKYDVLEWAHWLRSQDCRKLYGLGESLGASILIQSAAIEPQFQALVAECPYSDLRLIAEYRARQVLKLSPPLSKLIVGSSLLYARLRYGLRLEQVSPLTSIRQTSTPILLIHGLSDERTPPWHSRALSEAGSGVELWLVPGAGHTRAYSTDPRRFEARVLGWLAGR